MQNIDVVDFETFYDAFKVITHRDGNPFSFFFFTRIRSEDGYLYAPTLRMKKKHSWRKKATLRNKRARIENNREMLRSTRCGGLFVLRKMFGLI